MSENENSRESRSKIKIGVGFLLILALGSAVYWFFFMRGIVSTDDARIDGHLVDLAPQVEGKLVEVKVREGDRVKNGDVVFTLDKQVFQAALARAENELATDRSALEVARAVNRKAVNGPRQEEVKIARASKLKAEATLTMAEADWERARKLFEKGDIKASTRDKARTAWEIAGQELEVASQRLELLLKGTRSEDLEAAQATVKQRESQLAAAEEAVRQARINLDYTEVRAPFDGYIVRRWLDPGSTVLVSTPVVTAMDPATLYVSANIKEKDLNHLSIGNQVHISVDAYPGMELTGHVSRIMRATNSKFSLIPAEGVSGTYIKVTQRVPIRVELDSLPELLLGPGLSVEVKINYLESALHASRGNGPAP